VPLRRAGPAISPTAASRFSLSAAVYDVAEQRGHAAPAQDQITCTHDGVAWDGETLALVPVDRGVDRPDIDATIDEPITLRWRRQSSGASGRRASCDVTHRR